MGGKYEKVDALYIGPNRRFKSLRLEVFGLAALDEKAKRAWYIMPAFLVPLVTAGGGFIRDIMLVTERSRTPVNPRGAADDNAGGVSETWEAVASLARLSSDTGEQSAEGQPNWLILCFLMLVLTISIIGLVALATKL